MQDLLVVSHELWIAKMFSNTQFYFFHEAGEHCNRADLDNRQLDQKCDILKRLAIDTIIIQSSIPMVFSITERTYNLARTTTDAAAVKHPVTARIRSPWLSLETGAKDGTVVCLSRYILPEFRCTFL
jgi:hypothetical protein